MAVIIPTGFLDRTVRIKYGNAAGSAVYVQFDDVRFLLTAAHLVQNLQAGDNIGIRFQQDWQMKKVVGIAFGEFDTDVAALRMETQWGEGLTEQHMNGGLALGGEIAYCGFPLDLEMHGLPGSLGWPKGFVKSGVFSGAVDRPGGGSEYLFDAINNVGFSGGPIFFGVAPNLSLAGIVSGYKYDTTAPVYQRDPSGVMRATADYVVRPNSGFMIGTPIMFGKNAARSLLP